MKSPSPVSLALMVAGAFLLTAAAVVHTAHATPRAEAWYQREHSDELAEAGNAFTGPHIERYHDDEMRVTCWSIRHSRGPAITCLPDSAIGRKP